MAYTHDFEIETQDTGLIQGELLLNGANDPPKVKITTPVDVTMDDFSELADFFKRVLHVHKCYGDVTRIEIAKKV